MIQSTEISKRRGGEIESRCDAACAALSTGMPRSAGPKESPRPADTQTNVNLSLLLSTGMLLAGRYRILAQLGVGGMGIVYKARDEELGVDIALKVLRPDLGRDPEWIERFRRELVLAREVTHENVVRIHDIGESEGLRFLTMRLVEGRSLLEVLENDGPLPADRALRVFRQVAEALQQAHDARRRAPRSQAGEHSPRARRHRLRHGLRHRPLPGDGAWTRSVRSSEPSTTCRPSRRPASPWTGAATSMRSASSSSRCSRASFRSEQVRSPRPWPSGSRVGHAISRRPECRCRLVWLPWCAAASTAALRVAPRAHVTRSHSGRGTRFRLRSPAPSQPLVPSGRARGRGGDSRGAGHRCRRDLLAFHIGSR